MKLFKDDLGFVQNMHVGEPKSVPNKPFLKVRTFMLETTAEAHKAGKSVKDATWMDYEKVQEYIIKNKKEIFKGAKTGRYQINILTDQGWRAGKLFEKGDPIDFYDPKVYYDGSDDVDEIIAFQVVYM